MTKFAEEEIRKVANQIWESEGRPEGRADAHWAQALAQLEAGSKPAKKATATKKPAAAKKAPVAKAPAAKAPAAKKPTAKKPAK